MMASKRRLRRKACGNKERFTDQAGAIRRKATMCQRGVRFAAELMPYRCRWCGVFHLGHSPKWAGRPLVRFERAGAVSLWPR